MPTRTPSHALIPCAPKTFGSPVRECIANGDRWQKLLTRTPSHALISLAPSMFAVPAWYCQGSSWTQTTSKCNTLFLLMKSHDLLKQSCGEHWDFVIFSFGKYRTSMNTLAKLACSSWSWILLVISVDAIKCTIVKQNVWMTWHRRCHEMCVEYNAVEDSRVCTGAINLNGDKK